MSWFKIGDKVRFKPGPRWERMSKDILEFYKTGIKTVEEFHGIPAIIRINSNGQRKMMKAVDSFFEKVYIVPYSDVETKLP